MYLVMGLHHPWMQTWVQIIDSVEEDTEAQKNNSPRVPKLVISKDKTWTGPMYCLRPRFLSTGVPVPVMGRDHCSGDDTWNATG